MRSFALAACLLLLLRMVRSEAADYFVLADLSPHIYIRNVTLSVPRRTKHIACDGDAIVLFLSPKSLPEILASDPAHIPGGEAVDIVFAVENLIMGEMSGRSAIMVDDETVAVCPGQYCRVRLATNHVLGWEELQFQSTWFIVAERLKQ